MSEVLGNVLSLWRYPVKSMLGEELEASEVTESGLAGDRAFALIDPSDGKIGSAKSPRRWGMLFEFRAAYAEPPRAGRPLPPVRIAFPDGTTATADQPDIERRLSEALGREVKLASQPPPEAKYESLPVGTSEGDVVEYPLPNRFFDLGTLHLLTTASLERLAELYPQGHWDVRRFRPNIVVRTPEGQAGFVENGWVGQTLALGEEVRLRLISPTIRCVMTTLAQGDLPSDPQILKTAAQANQANVGVYAVVQSGGLVRRGDAVRVVEG